MHIHDYISSLEEHYSVTETLARYLAQDSGWRRYNDTYTWLDSSETATPLLLARKYFETAHHTLDALFTVAESGGPIGNILGARPHVLFLPTEHYNAKACLGPNGEEVIVIDMFLERTLGALALLLTSFLEMADNWSQGEPTVSSAAGIVRVQEQISQYSLVLSELVGSPGEQQSDPFAALDDEHATHGNPSLAREFQKAMFVFIFLHELAHHRLGHIKPRPDNFLETLLKAFSTKERELNEETDADRMAWMMWWSIIATDPPVDFAFESGGEIYTILQMRGGAPFLLFDLLQDGYSLHKPELLLHSSHPRPKERSTALRSVAENLDLALEYDDKTSRMLNAVRMLKQLLTESA